MNRDASYYYQSDVDWNLEMGITSRDERSECGRDVDRIHALVPINRVPPFIKLLNYMLKRFDSVTEMLESIGLPSTTYHRVRSENFMTYKTGHKILNAYYKLKQEEQ